MALLADIIPGVHGDAPGMTNEAWLTYLPRTA
jgi:hypothetical protein